MTCVCVCLLRDGHERVERGARDCGRRERVGRYVVGYKFCCAVRVRRRGAVHGITFDYRRK